MYGGGNIGRGFIGATLSQSGYEVTFIDVAEPVIQALQEKHCYPVRYVSGEGYEDVLIENVTAVSGNDQEAASEAIANCDIMATAVGARILKFIVPNIVAGLRKRWARTDAPLNIIICENLNDANKILEGMLKEQLSEEERALFDARVGLVEASIGRMVPVQTEEMKDGDPMRVCVERYGVTPTVLFDKLGMYDYGGGAFHCVHMSDEDIAIFKNRGLTAVLNPASNLKLASGIAPVKRFLDEGIAIAIGTDGAGSNNALDMFREMYLASVLQKIANKDAAAGSADRVLEMACAGGAGAMGLHDADDIAPGKLADLVVIDLHRPNMQPLNNIARNIVYSGSKENVRMTMVNGRILYENGEFFIGEAPEGIYEKANRLMERVRA